MIYLYLATFIAGLLLAVRLMFFGAERRRRRGDMPLRRSEPAAVAFLVMFGVAGYLLTRHGFLPPWPGAGVAALMGIVWAALVVWAAIAMARITPEHDPEDPRYVLQGHIAVVSSPIDGAGEGTITIDDRGVPRTYSARTIDGGTIDRDLEVCIERVEDGVAYVERWDLVEARL